MSEFAINAHGVSKRFTRHLDRRSTLKERIVRGRSRNTVDFWALQNVDMQVAKGSVYGIIGHNGSGKSTMLKLITGIYRPTSGSIKADGRVAALIELGAGFHPDMTGRENIRLNGSILGLSKQQISDAMEDIIDFSGLREFIDDPVKHYSSGMYVRLGFSVAVHMDPDVLLVDEVLAVVPDYPPALLLKAGAINRINGPEASLELLAPLATQHGQWPAVHFEHAKTLSVPLPPAALINTVFGRAQERSGFAGPRSSDLSAGKNKKGHLIRWPFF